ncbi:eukaryotic type KH-domain (KH-domain type I) [Bimuria novae-zelandiae CBS 107.79]|uniref:Pre-rRNA-processing protein PNO1 n=1 Tax=Bimuria novae-zelandiae CBS 107.79 TaxID=1447943 RepID=A0A6A5V2E2_9PLEO|nr:eukaryotic type KH-domain (KH-domain type I) [Bimuria novae-zelandiae CBS 107.79]
MPAPTALLRAPEALAEDSAMADVAASVPLPDDAPLVDMDVAIPVQPAEPTDPPTTATDESGLPKFPPAKSIPLAFKREKRNVAVPPHRYSPLKNAWPKIFPPLVEHLHLQVRMNTAKRTVEMRTSAATTDSGALQKGEDFVRAFCLGFDVDDAIALLRLDDLYIETFEIKDVKTLQGEHLGRAIGRIAGKDGKTKFAIENASRTRVVLADQKIHILGGFKNIHIAREAIVSLILGSQPGKVYGNLRTVAGRMKERF